MIAFVAIPAMTAAINGVTPRVSVRQVSNHRTADTARLRTRQDIYLNQGIERWGINE
jgi:hypothetical protein